MKNIIIDDDIYQRILLSQELRKHKLKTKISEIDNKINSLNQEREDSLVMLNKIEENIKALSENSEENNDESTGKYTDSINKVVEEISELFSILGIVNSIKKV